MADDATTLRTELHAIEQRIGRRILFGVARGGCEATPQVIHSKRCARASAEVVAQPDNFETEPVAWSNLLGGKVSGNKAVARFELGKVRELPVGDIDVVVITASGERRKIE